MFIISTYQTKFTFCRRCEVRMLSNDELKNLNNAELKQHFLDIRSKINIGRSKKQDVQDLEVYFCYISKELQDRQGG